MTEEDLLALAAFDTDPANVAAKTPLELFQRGVRRDLLLLCRKHDIRGCVLAYHRWLDEKGCDITFEMTSRVNNGADSFATKMIQDVVAEGQRKIQAFMSSPEVKGQVLSATVEY